MTAQGVLQALCAVWAAGVVLVGLGIVAWALWPFGRVWHDGDGWYAD